MAIAGAIAAIAAIAGPFWSGRALVVQNISQLFTTGIVPSAFGVLITGGGVSGGVRRVRVVPLAVVAVG